MSRTKHVSTKEGKVNLIIPEGGVYDRNVFYNPEAKITRDITIGAVQVFQKNHGDKIRVLDALSASGVRGLRIKKEVNGVKEVTLNDKNPEAIKLIRKNVKKNNVKCTVTNKDASLLMRENIYSVIDIDPFGPPVRFLDSAARSIYKKGLLAVTATDTAALTGKFSGACLRKYGIKSMKTDFYNELGCRIMISSIIKECAKYERTFIPVLTFMDKHYFRVFGIVERAGKLTKTLNEFGFVNYCECGNRNFGKLKEKCSCGKTMKHCGPIYLGKIQDKKFIKSVLTELKKRKFNEALKKIEKICDEADLPVFYYDIHSFSVKEMRKFEDIIKDLKNKGFEAGRTHFCKTGIKTDAPLKKLRSVL